MSQHSESPLFSSSHVIRKLNATLLEPTKECIYAHKKQIRDLTFHPLEHNLLASVSLDKCISLTDLVSNTVVSSVEGNFNFFCKYIHTHTHSKFLIQQTPRDRIFFHSNVNIVLIAFW